MSVDWYEYGDNENYDIVLANDIFPDVDQRLELFVERYLPHCRELRLMLTFYNEPKFYTTKRVDDTEIMTFLSWDGEILALKLKKYLDKIYATEAELDILPYEKESIYRNGRQTIYVKMKGDLS